MPLSFRRAEPPQTDDADRRTRTLRCESCQRIQGPLVHFLHRGDYCAECATPIYEVTHRPSSGRRSGEPQFPPYQSAKTR